MSLLRNGYKVKIDELLHKYVVAVDDGISIEKYIPLESIEALSIDLSVLVAAAHVKANGPINPVSEKQALSMLGKTFVFTGSLSRFTRSQAKVAVQSRGGRVADVVTSDIDYLVATNVATVKWNAARRMNIPILSADQFYDLLLSNKQANY